MVSATKVKVIMNQNPIQMQTQMKQLAQKIAAKKNTNCPVEILTLTLTFDF